MPVTISTGDVNKWAERMEQRGVDFAANVVKQAKKRHEKGRKQGLRAFSKIKRRKTEAKRFALQKPHMTEAELIDNAAAKFTDIFKD